MIIRLEKFDLFDMQIYNIVNSVQIFLLKIKPFFQKKNKNMLLNIFCSVFYVFLFQN
jgi:hypothetical protein